MNPRAWGKLGGRPPKAVAARSATARAVANGTQLTLNLSGNLTLSGTFWGNVTVNIGTTGGAGAGAGASASASAGAGAGASAVAGAKKSHKAARAAIAPKFARKTKKLAPASNQRGRLRVKVG